MMAYTPLHYFVEVPNCRFTEIIANPNMYKSKSGVSLHAGQ